MGAFNGTTVTFDGSAITNIRSVRYQGTCAKPSLTGIGVTTRLHRPGLPKRVTTITIVGASALVKGAAGALVVTWPDGGSKGSMANARLMKNPTSSGQLDSDNTTTLVFQASK
jgi:hypothetical protein